MKSSDHDHAANDQYSAGEWVLDGLLDNPSPEGLRSQLEAFEARCATFAGGRAGLDTCDGAQLRAWLEEYEGLLEDATRLGGYVSLRFSADTQSDEVLAQRNLVETVLARSQNLLVFFELWWQQLDAARAQQLIREVAEEEHPRRDDFVFHLHQWRREAKYRLAEQSEQIINLKNTDGVGAVVGLYSILTNGFQYTADLEGEDPRPMTRDELMAYAFSPKPQHREASYRSLLETYQRNSQVLGQMYVHRVRDWASENMELRGHTSPIGVRNVANDVPDAAIEALLDVVAEQAPVFHRYFDLKAKALGQERLSRFDLYAPMDARSSASKVPYGEAVELVLQTFARFDEGFAEQATRVFADRHVDALPRSGKKGGAFCATLLPSQTPWVLLNYAERLRDVATLAHELGHAVHSMMAERHSILTQHPCLPLAETASVFGEILVSERLLSECEEPQARKELLASSIDDIYATVMRQAFFVLFERDAHEAVAQGASIGDLSAIYAKNLELQFGSSMEVPDEFAVEWMAIPHIYAMPFYCYAYSFGQLLVLALYRRFREEGDAFVPGYLDLLRYGGSERPQHILEQVGVDMTDRAFWRAGLEIAKERIDQLEELVD